MSDLSWFTKLGKEMGLEASELIKFSTDQLKEHRDFEREQAQILKEREDNEREERRLAREEKRREDEERERVRHYEAEERERIRRHELELKKCDLEAMSLKSKEEGNAVKTKLDSGEQSFTIHSSKTIPPVRSPKLPFFNAATDDIDAYLLRFEHYAVAQNWEKDQWATNLSALLTGKALEIYARRPVDDVKNYKALKSDLLHQFRLTVEGYRNKFFTLQMNRDETASQFISRLSNVFDRYIQLSEIDESYAGLREMIVKDQFIGSCDRDLNLFLKERSPKTLEETKVIADRYLDARMFEKGRTNQGNSYVRNQTVGSNTKSGFSDNEKKTFHQNPRSNERYQMGGKTSFKSDQFFKTDRRCYLCNKVGHVAQNCGYKVDSSKRVSDKPAEVASLFVDGVADQALERNLPITEGHLFNKSVQVLRDTGCTAVLVEAKLVPPYARTGYYKKILLLDGTERTVPVATIDLRCSFLTGKVDALCVERSLCDVVVGNVPGAKPTTHEILRTNKPDDVIGAVCTRAQTRRAGMPINPLKVNTVKFPEMDRDQLRLLQEGDHSLRRYYQLAESGETVSTGKANTAKFIVTEGILFRQHENKRGQLTRQVMLPKELRSKVLSLGHESVMAGHLGISRTCERIRSSFYWPGLQLDVARFCKSCDLCQKSLPKGRVGRVPLGKMPVISTPFQRIAVDLIGPISPPSSKGNRYILTVVDFATRYPEAIPLPGISTEQVAEAMVQIYSRLGVPREVLSDQGTQFISELMSEIERLLSVKHLSTTPYHPQSNGLCERFNGTLKQMLKKLCAEKPTDWDRYIEPLLFSYREVSQESLGFSPFEMLYGRSIRGPMEILKELWTGNRLDEEVKTTYQYVTDLRERLEETLQMAQESLEKSQEKYKGYYDKKAKIRVLKPGDKVLILLPTDSNKLLMQWKGPFVVEERINLVDYKIKIREGKSKIFHINMLKQYLERESSEVVGFVTVVDSDESDGTGDLMDELLLTHDLESGESVNINPDLTSTQRASLESLINEFGMIFSAVPGVTSLVEHKIELTNSNPVRTKPYPIPFSLEEIVKTEVRNMLKLGIIEPSESPYSSPLILVRKKDNTFRPVIDFRKLNSITKFDSEPLPDPDSIFSKLHDDKYFSKIDCCKGYWQIPVRQSDRPKTAFISPLGLFQCVKMPFGMVNSGATYSRMMRKMLGDIKHADNFVDDVLTHTASWETHLVVLRELFEKVKQAGLTLKPSKCYFGYANINFLGHTFSSGTISTENDKVDKILNAPRPKTKKDVRAFMGLASYYRRFIPDFASISAPLTSLTKRGLPNVVTWEEEHVQALSKLKEALCQKPVLRLPDFNREFVLRTDASDVGIGAMLMQKYDDQLFPVMYISKKLLDREKNYSVIERECLAIVWSVEKLQRYLYGREFVLQLDHEPLSYMNKAKLNNPRVMRWVLMLQPYKFRIEIIKGNENIGADLLSRMV